MKAQARKFLQIAMLVSLTGLQSCLLYGKKDKLTLSEVIKEKSALSASISSVDVSNNLVRITGSNFSKVSQVSIESNAQTFHLVIDSVSDSEIVAKATSALALVVSESFNLILANAEAQASFPITFTLQSMGATSGQVLRFNGTSWAPSSLSSSQNYLGTWNATTNTPDISTLGTFNSGDYYIVTTAGTYSAIAYNAGDWAMFNGTAWEKIDNSSNVVSSFHGRKGVVTLAPSDYVSLKNGSGKLPGSSLGDLFDVDLTGIAANKILKYDGAKWVMGDDNAGGGGGIALTDLSASSPLSYNSSTGAFSLPTANILALPLTGLSAGTGALSATDTILQGFGKLMNVPSDYVSKSSGASITTGTIAVSGTGMITVPTATGVTATEVTNVTYVTNAIATAIASNGVWNNGASSSINYTAGNVGIGTTTPSSPLDVRGNLKVGTGTSTTVPAEVYIDSWKTAGNSSKIGFNLVTTNVQSADIQAYRESGSYATSLIFGTAASGNTTTTERMRINSVGNIGIGATAPSSKLSILNAANVGFNTDGLANAMLYLNNGSGIDGSIVIKSHSPGAGNAVGSLKFQASPDGVNYNTAAIKALTPSASAIVSDLAFFTSSSNISGDAPVERMRISGGNVGIGTTTPSNLLHVEGNAQVGSTGTGNRDFLMYSGAVGQYLNFQTRTGYNALISTAAPFVFSTTGSNYTAFQTNGSERIRVDSSGNIGIGTSSPVAKLVVREVHPAAGQKILTSEFGTSTNGALRLFAGNAGDQTIGTWLNWSTANSRWEAQATTTVGAQYMQFGIDGGMTFFTQPSAAVTAGDPLNFNTALRLAPSGNVGIGTTSPTSPLHIVGSVANDQLLLAQNTNANGISAFVAKDDTSSKFLTFGVNNSTMNLGAAYGLPGEGLFRASSSATGLTFSVINGPLKFLQTSSGTERMRIDTGGNVGIGTVTPSSALTVKSADIVNPLFAVMDNSGNALATFGSVPNAGGGRGYLNLSNPGSDGNGSGIQFRSNNGAFTGLFQLDGSGNMVFREVNPNTAMVFDYPSVGGYLSFRIGAGGPSVLYANNVGNIGIGTTAPAYKLDVNGTLNVSGATTNVSDMRFKREIQKIPDALEKISVIDGVTYKFKNEEFPDREFSHRREMGVIAQTVEKVFPEAVSKDQKGYRSVAYSMLIAPLIEAIKQLSGELKALVVRVFSLEDKTKTLEEKAEKLEAENKEIKAKLERIEKLLKKIK